MLFLTGLKKWRPTNLSFLLVASAISPIGKEEVFEAKIVWLGAAYYYEYINIISIKYNCEIDHVDTYSIKGFKKILLDF